MGNRHPDIAVPDERNRDFLDEFYSDEAMRKRVALREGRPTGGRGNFSATPYYVSSLRSVALGAAVMLAGLVGVMFMRGDGIEIVRHLLRWSLSFI